jgi:hypothetical protein
MKTRGTPSLACGLVAALALPAQAGIPGGGTSIEVRANDLLLHVCQEDPTIACVERDLSAFAHPYTGAECEAEGLAPACEIAFVKGSEVRGTLTLSADEDLATGEVALTLTYRFRLGGSAQPFHVLTESYPPGTRLGNWNPIVAESEIFDVRGEGQILDGSLEPVATELLRLLEAWFAQRRRPLPDAVPVVTRIERASGPLESDHAEPGTDPLGSSAHYLFEFRFARTP